MSKRRSVVTTLTAGTLIVGSTLIVSTVFILSSRALTSSSPDANLGAPVAVPTLPVATATATVLQIQEQVAVERAIDMARLRGLQDTTPTSYAAKQMSLAEYNRLADIGSGPKAAKVGLDPDQQVWVVTIKGQVEWSGPGSTGGDADKFDNITIVISAQTGDHIATLSARPGQPLPLNVP